MNVLNIDLDFFLNDRILSVSDDSAENRPDDPYLKPWKSDSVKDFLEKNLGLKSEKKAKGTVVKSHDEVYYIWRDLITTNVLSHPFNLTHIDAHSDLGLGGTSSFYILTEILAKSLPDRYFPKVGGFEGLDFGNYLAFAIANRWIRSLNFIIPECWRDDIERKFLTEESRQGLEDGIPYGHYNLEIELKLIKHEDIDHLLNGSKTLENVSIKVGEPIVPFNIIPFDKIPSEISKTKWDFVFLAQSPGYTPVTTDILIPIIQNYIAEI